MARYLVLIIMLFSFGGAYSQIALANETDFDSAKLIEFILLNSNSESLDDSAFNSRVKPIPSTLGPTSAWLVYKRYLYTIYGRRTIRKELPYYFYSYKDFYYYEGRLRRNAIGGTFVLIVSVSSGKIVMLTHYK